MQEKFMLDLEIIYEMVEKNTSEIETFYDALNSKNDKRDFLDEFLKVNHIKIDKESRYAIASRLVSLRDDSLSQVLKKQHFDEDEIIKIKDKTYVWVKEFYLQKHFELIKSIEEKELLTPFYIEVLKGIHNIGIAMSMWQLNWNTYIINGINRELTKEFNGDEEKIVEMLSEKNLLDKGHSGEVGDRCYSVLKKVDEEYESVAYVNAFHREVNEVLKAISLFKKNLFKLEDEVYNQKREYIAYLDALELAFSEVDVDRLIERWADVDRAWMKITTPLQIGHPLEYYEDHYRKAVAIEWDLRIINPKLQNSRVEKIKEMYEKLFNSFELPKTKKIYDISLQNLNKTQLYLGRPALYYGAQFNGLFSAQVVPNDEVVSSEYGKKIFAFADKVLQASRAKPFMKLSKVIFGEEFVKKERKFLFKETEKWHQIYDITTIGHEYGHILWMDEDTEAIMNKSGNFKNVEEFKATTGGLVSFFMNEENNLGEKVLIDTIKRAVGLLGWMEVDEVKPYYCEGLIHLDILFNAGVLDFQNNTLSVNISKESYERAKERYIEVYSSLAKEYYLVKRDASEFLHQFTIKGELNYMPKDEKVRAFAEYYYELYKEMGRDMDEEDSKENYL